MVSVFVHPYVDEWYSILTVTKVMVKKPLEKLLEEPQKINQATPLFSHVGSCYGIRFAHHLCVLISSEEGF